MLKLPLITCLALILLISIAGGTRTYIVAESGPANYKTIGEAVAHAGSGDTIYLMPGTYAEEVVVDKKLTIRPLVGEEGTFALEGKGKDTGLKITADGCIVQGLTIGNYSKSGLEIASNGNVILDNIFINDNPGILLRSSRDNRMEGNYFRECFAGMVLWSDSTGNTVSRNQLSGGTMGIFLRDVLGNNVTDNTVSRSTIGLHLMNASGTIIARNRVSGGNFGIRVSNASAKVEDNLVEGSSHGIYLMNSTGIELHNDSITDSSYSIALENCTGNTVTDCSVDNTSEALGLAASSGNVISGCTITDVKEQAAEIVHSNGNRLENNRITGGNIGLIMTRSTSNTLEGNIMKDMKWGLYVEGLTPREFDNLIAESNTVNGSPIAYFYGQSDKVIEGRELAHLTLAYCRNFTVRENNITTDAIFLFSSDHNRIWDNTVDQCYGMRLMDSRFNDLAGNRIYRNKFSGIFLVDSDGNDIRENFASENNQNGISLVNSSANNISGNMIERNLESGVWLNVSNDNRIYENNITSNPLGALIMNSMNNLVFHNNFLDNKEQAEDRNGDNLWDTGNVTGGNYWSDRKVRGNPSDGVPRIIKGLKKDNYPFESENGWRLINVRPPAEQPSPELSQAGEVSPSEILTEILAGSATENSSENSTENSSEDLHEADLNLSASASQEVPVEANETATNETATNETSIYKDAIDEIAIDEIAL